MKQLVLLPQPANNWMTFAIHKLGVKRLGTCYVSSVTSVVPYIYE